MKNMLILKTIEGNPLALMLIAGFGLCAYVVDKAKRGSFSIGLDGISVNFEK